MPLAQAGRTPYLAGSGRTPSPCVRGVASTALRRIRVQTYGLSGRPGVNPIARSRCQRGPLRNSEDAQPVYVRRLLDVAFFFRQDTLRSGRERPEEGATQDRRRARGRSGARLGAYRRPTGTDLAGDNAGYRRGRLDRRGRRG